MMQAACQMKPSSIPSEGRQDFGLTFRERQIIALVAAAYTNKDVAQKLGISQNTAKNHLTNVFDKLGVSNRLELLIFAVEHGLTEGD
jgi:DNA-binding CsgD family transcriptional regulator